MTVFVEGSYDTYEDAIRAVDTLVMRGHQIDDMKLTGNASALQEYEDTAGISAVEYSHIDNKEERDVLEEYDMDLNGDKLVLLVNEVGNPDKEQSVDAQATVDAADDAELLNDMQNSETDLSGKGSNDDVGLDSDLKTPTDDTAGGSGLNRSV